MKMMNKDMNNFFLPSRFILLAYNLELKRFWFKIKKKKKEKVGFKQLSLHLHQLWLYL